MLAHDAAKWKLQAVPTRRRITMPIPRRSFYFLRHGQTDWNAQGRFQGHTDVALNELGLSQAHLAAQALADCPIDIIVASPLIRALKTAAIIAERLNRPLFVDSALRERHFGAFEGLVINEVKRKLGMEPHERMTQHLPADAEQWHETVLRAPRAMGAWLERHPDDTLLFVTHAGLFDALHERIFGARLEPKHVPYLWLVGASGWTCNPL
jgi:probable phosphoglycerate mutase